MKELQEGHELLLSVPVRPRWWMKPPVSWFLPVRDHRKFGLDRFGREIWNACDGTRRIETICENFARSHSVSFEEARSAIIQFLRVLTQRELIVIQLPHTSMEEH